MWIKNTPCKNKNLDEEFPHPVKIDLDKRLDPKKKTIQAFNIDA